MNSRQWWMITGLMSLMISIGCSHQQVAATSSTEPQVASAEPQPSPSTPTPAPSTDVKPSVGLDQPFVSNDNLQTVYFDLSKSQLDEKAMDQLKKNADWLGKNTPYMIEITGYTDNRGSSKKNHWLAERRAIQVRDAYVALGIPKNRMLVKAIGEEGPACANLTEECLSQSRRAETLIENKAVAEK